MPSPRLVIFDCDGVLVDSEPIAIAVLREFLRGIGLSISEDEAYATFLGRGWGTVLDVVAARTGHGVSEAETKAMRAALIARFKTELKVMPGAFSALDALDDRIFCVASSSVPERLTASLTVTGLMPRFAPHIFSASEVVNAKPAPDLFLHVAARMGVDPAACVAIEDSPTGIVAARAAGMRVVAFLGGSHIAPAGLVPEIAALRPDATIDRLEDAAGGVAGMGLACERQVCEMLRFPLIRGFAAPSPSRGEGKSAVSMKAPESQRCHAFSP